MHAYANPENRQNELKRADGFGVARFNKRNRTITFECWPRFAKVSDGDKSQFVGWPVTVKMSHNDGRKTMGWLPKLVFSKKNQVVQIKNSRTEEILYTVRINGNTFQPKVYSMDPHEVRLGKNGPEYKFLTNCIPVKDPAKAKRLSVNH